MVEEMRRKQELENEKRLEDLRQYYQSIFDKEMRAYNETFAYYARAARQQLRFVDAIVEETPENKHLKQRLTEVYEELGKYENYMENWKIEINITLESTFCSSQVAKYLISLGK